MTDKPSPGHITGPIKGIRSDCVTGAERQVELAFDLNKETGWLHLQGGPTGYESFHIDKDSAERLKSGWSACAGTKGRWDSLFIPEAEMRELLRVLTVEFGYVLEERG